MTNFAQSIFENYSAEHYDDLALINSFVDPSILEKMLYKKTLIVSDDKYNYGYIFERYERLLQRRLQEDDKKYFFPVRIWRKIGRKLGLVKAALPISLHRVAIDSFSPEANGKYEIGLVCINRTLTARRLVEIFGTISDYGVILLELENRGAIVEIEEKQLQYLQQFCVLGELMLAPDSKWFLFLGKFLYSAKDFNTALVAALEKEIGRYRSEEKREVEEILAVTRERLGMLAENFSVLEKHFIDKRRVGDVLSS